MTNSDRYSVSTLITYHGEETREALGSAPSRRKARRLGYRKGYNRYPLLSSIATFELEIIDTLTGERVRADGAEQECYIRAANMPTVADVGYW